MEKCKFCQAELEEGATLCPACGKDNAEPTPVKSEEAPVTETEETPAVQTEEAPAEEAQEAPAVPGDAQIKPGVTNVTPGKLALAVAAVVVLLAVLIALVMTGLKGSGSKETTPVPEATNGVSETVETVPATVPADGDPTNVTCKGTYTAGAEEVKAARDTVVAVVDGQPLTNGQLQVYYWMGYHNFLSENYYYAPYYGLDYTQPLDVQLMDPQLHGKDYSMTWQHYFLQFALDSWHQVQAMALAAEEAGVEMDPEDVQVLEGLKAQLEEQAASYQVTLEEFLASNIGPGADYDDYEYYYRTYFRGAPYYVSEVEKLDPTDAEVEAYFDEHAQEYASGGITKAIPYVDVRHILVMPKPGTEGATTFTEAEWKACEDSAKAILDQWLAGDKTEESFAALANEKSEDGGSNTNGGLYQDVYVGQMVQAFNDWCFDESRQYGDYDIVKTEYGYHIMFFVSSRVDTTTWRTYAREDWISERSNALLASNVETYAMEVYYDKILLGELPEE